MQMLVASADLMAASSVLYSLLPAEITVSYPKFLGMFLTAQVAGITSHVPGGLGVVEAVLLLTLAPQDPAALMASMFVYRLIYYLLPLVLATMLLAGHEGLERREAVTRYARLFGRWAPSIIPRVLAGTTFAGGVTMLIYGALPRHVGRWHWVADFVPLPVVELSQLFGSVAGMGLLLLARPGRTSGNCVPPIDRAVDRRHRRIVVARLQCRAGTHPGRDAGRAVAVEALFQSSCLTQARKR